VGIVCCISALVVHDLTDEIPSAVQIAVPRSHRLLVSALIAWQRGG